MAGESRESRTFASAVASSSAGIGFENTGNAASSASSSNAFSNLFANAFSSAEAESEFVASTRDSGTSWSVVKSGASHAAVHSSTNQERSVFSESQAYQEPPETHLSGGGLLSDRVPNPSDVSSSTSNPNDTNVFAVSTESPKEPQEPFQIPIYVIAIVGSLVLLITLFIIGRCVVRRRKRQTQLAAMTPKVSDPRMAGVRADQPIQFVVPTTIIISETTEDSMSDTDYSSGGNRQLPTFHDKRKRRPYGGFHINPEDLERGLYEGVTSRMETGTFLGDLGKIGFSMHYNSQRSQLLVRIIGARDLPCLFMKTTANTCVKVVLMPDRTPKFITKVQRNSMNPEFNETFAFQLARSDLETKKLKISVWDYDRFSRKFLLGQILYSIKDSNLANSLNPDSTTGEIWIDLKQDSDTTQRGLSEVLLALSYNPDTASLTLSVLKARYLPVADKEKETVYAKVTLYVRRKLVRTKKTSSKKKAPELELNSSFNVHVPATSLSEVDFLVTLCEKSVGLGSKRLIGRTQIGSNCLSDQALQHWQDMLLSPKSTCAQWHVLSTF